MSAWGIIRSGVPARLVVPRPRPLHQVPRRPSSRARRGHVAQSHCPSVSRSRRGVDAMALPAESMELRCGNRQLIPSFPGMEFSTIGDRSLMRQRAIGPAPGKTFQLNVI